MDNEVRYRRYLDNVMRMTLQRKAAGPTLDEMRYRADIAYHQTMLKDLNGQPGANLDPSVRAYNIDTHERQLAEAMKKLVSLK